MDQFCLFQNVTKIGFCNIHTTYPASFIQHVFEVYPYCCQSQKFYLSNMPQRGFITIYKTIQLIVDITSLRLLQRKLLQTYMYKPSNGHILSFLSGKNTRTGTAGWYSNCMCDLVRSNTTTNWSYRFIFSAATYERSSCPAKTLGIVRFWCQDNVGLIK